MKNAIKYLVLSISCIVCFVLLVLIVALFCDIGSLSYPTTLILPILSYMLTIGGFVLLTIWAFKFSNNKAHKVFLIIALSLMASSALVYGAAKFANPIISRTNTDEKEKYFDFTCQEFVLALEEYGIYLDLHHTVDKDETNIKTYTFKTENDTYDTKVNYTIVYNETGNVTQIAFDFNRNFMGDIHSARTRYIYHINAIAEIIAPYINTDNIHDAIRNVTKAEKDETATYIGENFSLFASSYDEVFRAFFMPNQS